MIYLYGRSERATIYNGQLIIVFANNRYDLQTSDDLYRPRRHPTPLVRLIGLQKDLFVKMKSIEFIANW